MNSQHTRSRGRGGGYAFASFGEEDDWLLSRSLAYQQSPSIATVLEQAQVRKEDLQTLHSLQLSAHPNSANGPFFPVELDRGRDIRCTTKSNALR